ncbi:MAG: exo-alpha-sialidase [Ktedonobacteraceae bacterium]|nr:exo-alpha-sialidase [Ktedonobacteraceae bacterium]
MIAPQHQRVIERLIDLFKDNPHFSAMIIGGSVAKERALPTTYDGGAYGRVSDSVVAYDLAHNTWLISSLAIKTTTTVTNSTDVIVSRSHNGLTWSKPVLVAESGLSNNFDKDWVVCDQHPGSKFFGRCYMEWDDSNNNGRIMMSYSDDGGLTWSQAVSPVNQSFAGLGGQPVVQPDGNVIVPIYGYDLTTGAEGIYSYTSIDGGMHWTDPIKIAPSTYFS